MASQYSLARRLPHRTTGSSKQGGEKRRERRLQARRKPLTAHCLPQRSLFLTCFVCHSSSETERTNEMCTPRFRWMPEQRMHMNMPRFADAQRGPAQGTHVKAAFSIITVRQQGQTHPSRHSPHRMRSQGAARDLAQSFCSYRRPPAGAIKIGLGLLATSV